MQVWKVRYSLPSFFSLPSVLGGAFTSDRLLANSIAPSQNRSSVRKVRRELERCGRKFGFPTNLSRALTTTLFYSICTNNWFVFYSLKSIDLGESFDAPKRTIGCYRFLPTTPPSILTPTHAPPPPHG
ncbi:hypothetical protein AVEN_135483-1 [Araneus ventricosus]|uniref:Uncharacterized protein n=1 Tax=Araneus ventricosus TaxID=182803 RepID=A0A4Y2BCV4_ARAVE|nr:hypothetical protein AVEN_135483-1 [Araneus ventricosus]